MQDFRKLKVWVKAHELALAIYRVTETFPKSEIFGLTSQMRRSAASIPANIAEGCGRGSNADLVRFLHVAMGSAKELEYQLILARDLGLIPNVAGEQCSDDLAEVERMLSALIVKLRSR